MRVLVHGHTDTAKGLRSLVAQDAVLILGERYGQFTIKLSDDATISHPVVDGVDSELERLIVTHIARAAGAVTVLVARGQAAQTDAIGIRVPSRQEAMSYDVERSVYRALLDQARPLQAPDPWHWRLRAWVARFFLLAALVLPAAAAAQAPVTVRDSSTGVVVPNIGDNTNDALRVNVVAGAGSGGTAMSDRATFTFGTTNLTPIGGVFDDTPPSVLTTGMVGVPRLTANRALHVNLRDASGTAVTITGNSLNVNCTGGCGGASVFEDNDAFTFNTTGVAITGYVVDDTGTNAVTENSAGAPRMAPNRVPYGILRDAAGNERGANVTAANELLVEIGAGAASIGTLGANSGVDIGDVTINNAAGASAVNIQDGGNSITVDGTVTVTDGAGPLNVIVDASALPTGAATEATLGAIQTDIGNIATETGNIDDELGSLGVGADNTANPTTGELRTFPHVYDGAAWDRWRGAVSPTILGNEINGGSGIAGSSTVRVVIATDQTVIPVKEQRAATPVVTSVADSATNVTCLASNANRLGATIYNDSASDAYVKLGATASTTSFTVKLFQDGFFTVPFGYTGIIDCIWSADSSGSARVTEVTQ